MDTSNNITSLFMTKKSLLIYMDSIYPVKVSPMYLDVSLILQKLIDIYYLSFDYV